MRRGQTPLPLEMRKGNGLGEREIFIEICFESVSRNLACTCREIDIPSIGWLYSGPTLRATALCSNAAAAVQVVIRMIEKI